MKKSLIWTTAGIAAVGFGVPAFAAHNDARPVTPAPASVTVATPATVLDDKGVDAITVTTPTTPNSVEDNHGVSGSDDATENSVEDSTDNSVDDSTENSVEDVRGNCDEAEHANDASCTGQATTVSVDDNSGTGSVVDNSGRGGAEDNSGHGGKGSDSRNDG